MAKFLYSWGVLFRFVQFLVGRIKKRNNNNNKNRFFSSNSIHISIVIVCLFGICHCYGGIYSYSIRVFFDCHFNGRIISLMSRMSHRENLQSDADVIIHMKNSFCRADRWQIRTSQTHTQRVLRMEKTSTFKAYIETIEEHRDKAKRWSETVDAYKTGLTTC